MHAGQRQQAAQRFLQSAWGHGHALPEIDRGRLVVEANAKNLHEGQETNPRLAATAMKAATAPMATRRWPTPHHRATTTAA